MIAPDRLASWRRKATPGTPSGAALLAACNEVEALQRLAESNRRAAVAHRAGEDILQQNVDALVAEKDALEQENARLTEQARRWAAAEDIIQRARRKDYNPNVWDLVETLGWNEGGE
jgi:exonuclease VII large subunit